jgi:hypothetical protein
MRDLHFLLLAAPTMPVPCVVGRTPWSARVPLDPLSAGIAGCPKRPTRASAADQGVRPTMQPTGASTAGVRQ